MRTRFSQFDEERRIYDIVDIGNDDDWKRTRARLMRQFGLMLNQMHEYDNVEYILVRLIPDGDQDRRVVGRRETEDEEELVLELEKEEGHNDG